jgi:hypothetical protein
MGSRLLSRDAARPEARDPVTGCTTSFLGGGTADSERLAFSGAAATIESVFTAATRPYVAVGGNSTISSQ